MGFAAQTVVPQRASMLDLVRRTCDDARGLDSFEGVYEPDPDQVAAWENQEAEEYGGEFRFVNVPPTRLAHMVEMDNNPDDQKAMEVALTFWRGQGGGAEAGEPYRGEPREAIVATSMRELAAAVSPVSHVFLGGTLRAGGMPSMGEPVGHGEYRDLGVIDWGLLMSMGPLPDDEDWF